MRIRRPMGGLPFLLLLALAAPAFSQDSPDATKAPIVKNGIHLYEVALSLGSSTFNGTVAGVDLGKASCDCFATGAVAVGYSHAGPTSNFEIIYTPTYWNRFGISGLRTFNQSLRLGYESRFAPAWRFSFSATADDSSIEELIFNPPAFASVSAAPTTPSGELDSFVSASTSLQAPSPTLFYGGRVLTFGARTGLTYRPSSRLRYSFEAGAFESQTRQDASAIHNQFLYVIPRTRFEIASTSAGYSLNPLTEVGMQFSASTYHTVFGDYRTTLATSSYARKFNRHWSTLVQSGIGIYTPLQSKLAGGGSELIGSAGLNYQGRENTLYAGYQRTAGDLYGLAASRSQGVQGIWTWKQPGRNWLLTASGSRQKLTGGPLSGATDWQASAALTHPLGDRVWLTLSYGYLRNSLSPGQVYNSLAAHVIRLTLVWTPVYSDRPPVAGGTSVIGTN